MLRCSYPPGPLGPTAAHIPASISMLYTLTSRVFLLSVATSVMIMALEAFKKIWHCQKCSRGMVDGAPGIFSLLSASASMRLPHVSGYLRDAGRKSGGQGEGGSHRIQKGQDIGYTPVRIANRRNVYP